VSEPSWGTAWGNWLVSKMSGVLDAKLSRRSFIARTTLFGSAVAVGGVAVAGCQGAPYQVVTDCPGGTLCTDGYTDFCCTINGGVNTCPPNTLPAGWWRADGSLFCYGAPRYYIDCNQVCCGPGYGNTGFCYGCSPCRCAGDCNTRRVYCNYFRYGQCNTGILFVGPIACRMVSCTPPYLLNLGCGYSDAVDDSTADHYNWCANYPPPPPPPPTTTTTVPSVGIQTAPTTAPATVPTTAAPH